MTLKTALITCIAASSLTACAFQDAETPYREIVRVPYTFSVKSFVDAREEAEQAEVISSKAAYPFKKEHVAQNLIHNMNNSLFTSTPAFLDIRLKNYSAIKEESKYFLSMIMDITAKNDTHVTLASGTFGCISEQKESFQLRSMLGLAAKKGEVVVTDRYNEVWQRVIERCTADIAYEFNSQIGRNN